MIGKEEARCTRCRRLLPLDQFRIRKSGRQTGQRYTACRSCERAANRQWHANNPTASAVKTRRWRVNNPERVAEINRQRAALPIEVKRAYRQKWAAKNADRIRLIKRAEARVRYGLRTGRLVRPEACEVCGRRGVIEAAHADYSKPYEIRWLCRSCHREWDAEDPKSIPGRLS